MARTMPYRLLLLLLLQVVMEYVAAFSKTMVTLQGRRFICKVLFTEEELCLEKTIA
jgi:hypothetical protein